ncbi:tRNA (adenosine(37)-N6)-threonylcarbamoyltransferase complex dimerization subunit type 1 TsaB [Candidatus Acidulodesulfobacterium sp. H_13]|uniref:tRNA (adenosine(37)-N6)-threonylcarbamoyltransferase complex dimerization subunit type 1 TsaB n=1 Tax=Candidatus Acidulodesulfobacterium sp. H_13 TaxID=3395470 RepID=UPI003AF6B741
MAILSIDSSNGYSNILITDDNLDKTYGSISGFHEKHSVLIFKQIDEMTKKAGIKLNDLTEITVILGPGSYTGIRVSLTIAKTLSYCLGINIIGISGLFICAYSLLKSELNLKDIVTVKDAMRNDYYVSSYVLEKGSIIPSLKISLFDLSELESFIDGIGDSPTIVYGYNKKDDYERFTSRLERRGAISPFDLKKTTGFASMYAMESGIKNGSKYTEEISPYYIYGDGPF